MCIFPLVSGRRLRCAGEGNVYVPFRGGTKLPCIAPCLHASPYYVRQHSTQAAPCRPATLRRSVSDEPRYLGSLFLRHFVRICDRVAVHGRPGRPRREQPRQPILFEPPLKVDPASDDEIYMSSSKATEIKTHIPDNTGAGRYVVRGWERMVGDTTCALLCVLDTAEATFFVHCGLLLW